MTVDPLDFRAVIGNLATGVTVITVAHDGMLQGMTANAVASLSLDPVLVLVCIDRATHTHAILERSGKFAVNVLAEDQEDISRLFAKKAEPERGSLRGAKYRFGETGSPLLEGCLAHLECRVYEAHTGGDHTIFLGEVMAMDADAEGDRRPLLFFRGRYHGLA